MRTMAMTPGRNADIIWIVRINMDSSYFYFSTEFDKITLDAVDFDGKVILKDGISDMENGIVNNGINGGNISIVPNFTFSIVRYNNYSGSSNFFNDFYPATGKDLLTAKTVDVGITWRGATTLAEITWLESYYIQQPSVYHNRIECFCVGFDELSNTQIPSYKMQKENDNAISYQAIVPEDIQAQPMPIVYGDFSTLTLSLETYNLAPTLDLGSHNYKATSHICKEVDASDYLYRYLSNIKTFAILHSASASNINTRAGHRINLGTGLDTSVLQDIYLHPRGYISGGSNYENAVDNSSSTYATLAVSGIMEWKLSMNLSESEFGRATGTLADMAMIIEWDANGGNVNYQVKYWHTGLGVNSGYSSLVASGSSSAIDQTITYTFGQGNYDYGSNPKKINDTADWKADELELLEFHILNLGTSTGTMRIKNIYFKFLNQTVYTIEKSKIPYTRNTGERPVFRSGPKIINLLDSANVFAKLKGQIFDNDMV